MLLVQRVEGVEEFFLRAFFSRDELNVVHQQHVHGVKTFAEADHAVEPQRVDHFDGELLCAYVAQAHRRVALLDGVPDGVHQVGLAHAHAAVQEQRVVRFGGLFRDGARRGVRKLIGLADHESVEGIAQIQLVVAALKIQFGLPRFGGCCRRRGYRLFLAANVLDFNTGSSEFVEHRFDDIPVSAREHLPENRTGNLDEERLTLGTVQPGRLEPSCEGVDADPGFDMVQKRLPGICCFAPNLGCCSHRRERKSCTISTDVQNLWKEGPTSTVLQASGCWPTPDASLCPCRSVRGL